MTQHWEYKTQQLYNVFCSTCVSFGARGRNAGVAARQQASTNLKNTVIYFKHLLGRAFDDPIAQQHLKNVPCTAVRGPNGEILLEVCIFLV